MNLYEVKKNKQSVKDFVLDRFNHRQSTMIDIYRTWMLNLAWVRGFQNVDFDTTTKKFQSLNLKHPWKVRLIANLMLPIVRRNVSQLIYNSSVWDVIPATSDQDDIEIANTSTKILRHYWDKLRMTKQLIRVAFWQSICSSAFLKIGWDADLGDEITVETKNLEEELVNQFMEIMGFTQLPEILAVNAGDLFVDVISPFNLIFDDGAAVIEDSMWSIESQIKTKDWVVEKYGNKYKNLTESTEQELFLYPFIQGERTGKLPKTGILVHEIFIKHTSKFKDGLHCILTGNGEILEGPKKHPYEHGDLPYTHFLEIYDPASFWGTNTAEQVRPAQARYNRVQSGILENINLNSNIQWLNPNQSGINQFNNQPGKVYNYNAPFKPEQMQPRPIPAYIEGFLNRTRLDIQDIASNHDVSEAKAEPGVRSGRAVLALQDADDSIKGPVLLWFDQALASTGRLALQTISQFSTHEKVIEITGTFNEVELLTFSGETLKGKSKSDYFKVRVKTYGRQPLSRSARESLVRTLLELGLVHPQINREELLHILGAADILSIFDQNSSERTRQWNEIQILIQGQPVGVYFGQNHDAHINSIKKYIASSYWDKLQHEQKEMISQHLMRHLEQQTIELIYQQAFASGMLGMQNGTSQRSGQQRTQEGRTQEGRTQEGRTQEGVNI